MCPKLASNSPCGEGALNFWSSFLHPQSAGITGTRNQTQDFVHTKQAHYQLSPHLQAYTKTKK